MQFNVLRIIFIVGLLLSTLMHNAVVATENNTSVRSQEQVTKFVTEKIANITRVLRLRPLKLPPWYNRLQIPTFSHIFQMHENPNKAGLFDEKQLMELVVSGAFALRTNTTLIISSITDFDEVAEEITFAADLTFRWTDAVIYGKTFVEFQFKREENHELVPEHTDHLFKTIDNEIMKQIWKPDIFIENTVEIKYPELMSKPVSVRVNELVGGVLYAARIRVQMACEMDFHYYPADIQKCELILRSNSYSREELVLNWAKPIGASLENCEGSAFDFQIDGVGEFLENEVYLNNIDRNFSALRLSILARRKLSYHVVQTFLPSVFFIVITWLCFLIPSAEVRIGVAMTTLLTLTAMFSAVRGNSPKVTYVRGIDIWMLACIVFVFLTLLEFVYVVWARNKKEEIGKKHINLIEDTDEPMDQQHSIKRRSSRENEEKCCTGCTCAGSENLFECVDKYAVFIFSFIFVIFCTLYWRWLIYSSGYLGWNVDNSVNCIGDNPKDVT